MRWNHGEKLNFLLSFKCNKMVRGLIQPSLFSDVYFSMKYGAGAQLSNFLTFPNSL